jgi:hypothetical protein
MSDTAYFVAIDGLFDSEEEALKLREDLMALGVDVNRIHVVEMTTTRGPGQDDEQVG